MDGWMTVDADLLLSMGGRAEQGEVRQGKAS